MTNTLPRLALLWLWGQASAWGAKLPSVSHRDNAASALERQGKWWARVGKTIYHEPPQTLGLSQKITDYYYARGAGAALTPELKQSRVGGSDNLHIFHLPGGPASLKYSLPSGGRRSSLSSLLQLSSGVSLRDSYPPFTISQWKYTNPLTVCGQNAENMAVAQITEDGVMHKLTSLLESTSTRSWNNPEGTQKATGFLQDQFTSMGFQSCLQDFQSGGTTFTNVVAHIPGRETDTVTIGAHYDSRPYEGAAPGAEDNGSGVAALLAIAQALSARQVQPQKTIILVAFAGEEPGLKGSAEFAKELLAQGGDVSQCPTGRRASSFMQKKRRRRVIQADRQSAIVMDEVGWKSGKLDKPTINLETADTEHDKTIMKHLAASSLDHNGDDLALVHNSNPYGSDHVSFLSHNIGTVLTINGDDENYPNYHRSTDTIDNVNGNLLAMTAKMNLGALLRLSGVQCE